MPQSYSSFNPQGPNVDVNLFSNAASAGINQGNAQKTTWQAVAEGVTDAIQTGTSVASGLAALEAQQIQNEFNSDPEVRAAKEQAAVAEGTLKESAALEAQLQAQIIRDNEEIYKSQKLEDLKARAAESSQKRQDIENMSAVSTALSDPLPANKEAIFRNNNVLGTLLRYPDFGARSIAALEAQGVNPDLVNPWKQSISAVEMEKRYAAMDADKAKKEEAYKLKNEQELSEAQAAINGMPEYQEYATSRGGNVDPRKLRIYSSNTVNVIGNELETDAFKNIVRPTIIPDGQATYVVADGKNVIARNLSPEEGRQYQKYLNTLRINAKVSGYPEQTSPDDTPTGAGLAEGVPQNNTGIGQNKTIINMARDRNSATLSRMQSRGTANGYQEMLKTGAQIARRTAPATSYISTPQSVPVAPNTPSISQNVPDAPKVDSIGTAMLKLSKLLGTNNVSINVAPSAFTLDQESIDRINSIPVMGNAPAILKGMSYVESRGKIGAVSGAGAVGLMQIMPNTGKVDLGLTPEELADPTIAIPAAGIFLMKQYERVSKSIATTFKDTRGIDIRPDPRMVLAAYNGGHVAIDHAIRAGAKTWDDVKQYIMTASNKSDKNKIENVEYADKVIAASIPFIVGGNASDDSFLSALQNYNIIEVSDGVYEKPVTPNDAGSLPWVPKNIGGFNPPAMSSSSSKIIDE
jgi:soluble lytic murein transglycosylase-like protein